MKRKYASFLVGYLFLFVAVLFCVSSSILLYAAIADEAVWKIALVLFFNILLWTLIYACVDWLRRKFTVEKQVEEILLGTKKLIKGDFSVRLVPQNRWNRYDEYDRIKENFNKMAEELSQSELLKKDFVANVSHEMKTPLFLLRGYAETLSGDPSEEEKRECLAGIVETTKRMNLLIGNVLKLNKLEHGQLGSEAKAVNLSEALAEGILSFEEAIDEKEIELTTDIDEIFGFYDCTLLELIWNNLLSNAVKFTERGGRVFVSLKRQEKGAELTVQDTGCGISEQAGSRIFEKFYQGDTSHRREGNGLGLALVKKVIDKIGGTITVESEQGKGSTFRVVFFEEEV
ncbi:MAG: sensor histidine kinase [Clostridia bacterium]|nr:sensor histidine kinase [Clostridia bacterium]